jgi:acyl-CoA synthetase (AMP-forming)/AMP-acid ligase II
VAFGAAENGRADRVVIVVEPSGTVPSDVLAETIRRRISDLFGLYVDDVALVPRGTVARTTSGKVQRAATKARYEKGELRGREAGLVQGLGTSDQGSAIGIRD